MLEVDAPEGSDGDERRRFYDLTGLGRAVVRAEAERMRALVQAAEARSLLGPTKARP